VEGIVQVREGPERVFVVPLVGDAARGFKAFPV